MSYLYVVKDQIIFFDVCSKRTKESASHKIANLAQCAGGRVGIYRYPQKWRTAHYVLRSFHRIALWMMLG